MLILSPQEPTAGPSAEYAMPGSPACIDVPPVAMSTEASEYVPTHTDRSDADLSAAGNLEMLTTAASGAAPTLKRHPDEETWGLPPKRRVRAKPDGRCQIRAVLHATGAPLPVGVKCILTDDSRAAREHIQRTRAAAAQRVKTAMLEDETLGMIISCDFPDEHYETFDEWFEAMCSDDTEADNSSLWHGGGQWLLYGLGLLLEVTIEVTSLHPLPFDEGNGFTAGGSQDVVAGGDRRIYLAMLHNDIGAPDHFDVLAPIEATEVDADTTMHDAPPLPESTGCRETAMVEMTSFASIEQEADAASVAQSLVMESLAAACEECDSDCCWVRTGEGSNAPESNAALTTESSWRDWALGLVLCRTNPN